MNAIETNKKPSCAFIVVTVFVFFVVAFILAMFFALDIGILGTATLPGGAVMSIDAGTEGFSASEGAHGTVVEIAGRDLEFTPTAVLVDGAILLELEDPIQQAKLTTSSDGVHLEIDGKSYPLP
ncbi:hypothetical protein Mal64_19410 [Pseudobythopirellula maris]|uniref:Uncharacterized protein n=1 Tax=Pseudobythopirellula maris TaxID=2527991 RepID=A0A5C5ZM34_9BACT|nr:hypothetical protein [Pseudobythopirellula maris]TWT88459.1 hypothetical protein Mal64_19410 [Pseudobythopirellula maris]